MEDFTSPPRIYDCNFCNNQTTSLFKICYNCYIRNTNMKYICCKCDKTVKIIHYDICHSCKYNKY